MFQSEQKATPKIHMSDHSETKLASHQKSLHEKSTECEVRAHGELQDRLMHLQLSHRDHINKQMEWSAKVKFWQICKKKRVTFDNFIFRTQIKLKKPKVLDSNAHAFLIGLISS